MAWRIILTRRVWALLSASVFLAACGSAYESSHSTTLPQQPASVAPPTVLAQYEVQVDPLHTKIDFVDQSKMGFLGQFLGQVLGASDIQISNASTNVYNDGLNKISLAGINNQGLCIKNIRASGHFQNLFARLKQFTPTSVTPGQGTVNSGGTGEYLLNFGDVPNGVTACRPFSLTNSTSVNYRFLITFEATVVGSAPTSYITDVSSTRWLLGDNVLINGADLSSGSGASVCLTDNPTETPFCTSGYLIPDGNLVSQSASQIQISTTGLAVNHGFVVVKNSSDIVIPGPYVEWTSRLHLALALPSGSQNATVFLRTWNSNDGLDVNNCPQYVTLNDSTRVNNVALTTTPTDFYFDEISVEGAQQNLVAVVDVDGNGALSTGDYVQGISNVDIFKYQNNEPSNLKSIALGDDHACGIDQNSALYCWGLNTDGQLGDGTHIQRLSPTLVSGMSRGVTAVELGPAFTCAIQDGAAKCWGYNGNGELGDGTQTSRTTPTQVVGLTQNVTAIASSYYHTCAIQNGAAKCWGNGNNGELGDGSIGVSTVPVDVAGLDKNVTDIATGWTHSCAVVSGGVKCWGNDDIGQLGDGPGNSSSPVPVDLPSLPTGVTQISASNMHTCAIVDGGAQCWGFNPSGQVGDGTSNNTAETPVQVVGLTSGVTSISAGEESSCAVVNGQALCWGLNSFGLLGDGTNNNSTTPVAVLGMTSGVGVIKTGRYFSCAIQNSTLQCWGFSSAGGLGNGRSDNYPSPQHLTGSGNYIDIKAGHQHACGVDNGAVKCWGDNGSGQLGDGSTSSSTTAVQTSGLTSGATAVGVGGNWSCAILSGGSLKCWGQNFFGELGDGTTTQRLTPVNVSGLSSGVTQVAGSSGFHTCAVVSGAAKCWGHNDVGQVGDSTNTDRRIPTQVSGLTTSVSAISAGNTHNCAIVSGAAKCWGWNAYGQLGDNTQTNRNAPVQVSGLTSGVTAISAATRHTCAIVSGAAYCWGGNQWGQLGDGTTSMRLTPVAVSGMSSGVTAILAGREFTCAVHNSALKCWGDNTFGQLGDGTFINSSTPVSVSGISGTIQSLTNQWYFVFAGTSNGLYSWGSGNTGALGIGISNDPVMTPNPILGNHTFYGPQITFSNQILSDCGL